MDIYRNQTTLITGASSGIGEAFAHELARRGSHLILVARTESKLKKMAAELSKKYSVRCEVIPADLIQAGAAKMVYQETQKRGLPVDFLINNAGFGTYGPFDTLDPGRDHDEVMLNVTSVVDLTHQFLPDMVRRKSGGIINVASTAAFQPLPYMAVYGATKAFVVSFSEALWAEYRNQGVRVMALCPGATETPFFDVVGASEPAVGIKETPEKVVRVGLKAFEQGRCFVVSGMANYLLSLTSRFTPRSLTALIAQQFLKPKRRATKTASTRA